MTTPTTVSVRLQLRADTAANWTSANPTLLANELGRETDTGKIKIGDGSTAWSSLAYQAWATLPIAVASGGTGQTSYTNGQLLIGNTTGNTLTKATLTAGSGIAITNGTGSITVAASGISDAQIATDAEIAVSKLADGAARQLLQTDAAGTGVEWASNIDIPGTLDVTSTATFDSIASHPLGAAATPSITFTGDTNTGIYSPGADQVSVATGGTERLRIDSTGQIEAVSLGTAAAPTYSFTTDANTGIYSPGADQIAISTNGTGRLFVDAGGRLLVGTSSAFGANYLQIQGDQSLGSTGVGAVSLRRGAALGDMGASSTLGRLEFGFVDGGVGAQIAAVCDAASAGTNDYPGRLIFSTTADGGSSPTERLRITSTGALNFVGAGTAGSTQAVSFNGSAPVNSMVLDSSGRLGIGTSSPAKLLEVNEGDIQIRNSSTASLGTLLNYGLTFRATNQVSQDRGTIAEIKPYLGSAGDNDFGLQFRTQTTTAIGVTTKMTLTPGGSLGIGTTSPGAPLHVNGGDIILQTADPGTRLIRPTFAGGALQLAGSSATSDRGLRFGFVNNALSFSEFGRFDESGRLLVGTSSSVSNVYLGGNAHQQPVQVVTATNSYANGLTALNYSASGFAPVISLGLSKSNSLGSNTAVASGDDLGIINFVGNDGTNFRSGAFILAAADGGVSTGDLPTRLVFSTTADGASSPTERMRINNTGTVTINGTTSVAGGTHTIQDSGSSPNTLRLYNNTDSNNTGNRFLICDAGASVLRAEIRSNGGLANYSANNANLSDRNAKKDIALAAGTWDCIKEWEIVNYRYKDQPDDADLNLGVIAQQVAESCPEVITVFEEAKDDQPEKLGVKEQQMYWMAIKALQEAQVRIEALEAEVSALKAA